MRPGGKNDPRELVYRREPRTILCVDCAQKLGIQYRPSARWEQSRKARNHRRAPFPISELDWFCRHHRGLVSEARLHEIYEVFAELEVFPLHGDRHESGPRQFIVYGHVGRDGIASIHPGWWEFACGRPLP